MDMKHIAIVLLIFVCLVTPALAEDITWEELQSSANWTARSEHATCWFDDKYWVIGGYNATGYVNDVWYSTDGVGWFCANYSAEFSPRGGHAVLAPGDGYMYLIGGANGSITQVNGPWYIYYSGSYYVNETAFEDVYKSNDGEVWELVTTTGNFGANITYMGNTTGNMGVSYFGAGVGNGLMWVLGGSSAVVEGSNNAFPGTYFSNHVFSSDDGLTWNDNGSLAAYDVGTGWAYHQSPWMSETIIGGKNGYFGSYDYFNRFPSAGTVYSTYGGEIWSTRTETGTWQPRTNFTALYTDSKLILFGGYGSDDLYKRDVWYSINEGETWVQYSDADWNIREFPQGLVDDDGNITIFGGYSSAEGFYNDVWRGYINESASSSYSDGESGAGIQYPPHDVLFTIRDLSGSPVSGVTVTAQPTETTMGNWDWLKNLFGIDTEDVNIAGTNMTGTTGSDGTISFIMMEDIRYHITLYSETDSISESYDIYPKDETYLFVVGTADLPKPTTVAAKYISYDLEADYENNTYVNFTFEWMDESNGTTFVWWNVTNGTTTLETQNLTPSGGYTNESYAMLLGYTDASYTYGFNAYHPTYGWTNQSKTLMDHKEVDIGLSGTWLNFGAFGLIAMVGLMFSRKSWKIGMFVTCIFALALTQMHILIINESYESTMFILGGLTFLSVIILLRGSGDKNV